MDIIKPELKDIEILKKYLKHNKYRGCEFSAANTVLWSSYYNTCYTIVEDMLLFCRAEDGKPVSFTFPIGEKNHKRAFDAVIKYFEDNDLPFLMHCISEDMYKLINEWYPDEFEIEYNRDYADYIYTVDKLANLKGKHLHGKRNHINRFLENYPDYEFVMIDKDNEEECIKIASDWNKEKNSDNDEEAQYEVNALRYAIRHMDELGLFGALIRVEGKAVAFTLADEITEDTADVHFEKAYADIQRAYAMINREFVRNCLGKYKYVNREENLGIPGLRKAKLSYKPDILYEKGLLKRK